MILLKQALWVKMSCEAGAAPFTCCCWEGVGCLSCWGVWGGNSCQRWGWHSRGCSWHSERVPWLTRSLSVLTVGSWAVPVVALRGLHGLMEDAHDRDAVCVGRDESGDWHHWMAGTESGDKHASAMDSRDWTACCIFDPGREEQPAPCILVISWDAVERDGWEVCTPRVFASASCHGPRGTVRDPSFCLLGLADTDSCPLAGVY